MDRQAIYWPIVGWTFFRENSGFRTDVEGIDDLSVLLLKLFAFDGSRLLRQSSLFSLLH